LKPKYLSIDLNLPMDMTKEQLVIVWDTIHKECEKLGITVITDTPPGMRTVIIRWSAGDNCGVGK